MGVSQDQTLITKCLNSWDVQSKHIQPEDGKAEALYSGECRYGGGESYVMQSRVEQHAICVDQGAGKSSCQIEIEKSPTLATTHDGAPAVCIGNGQLHNATMKPIANSLDTMHDQQAILVYDKETPVTSIDEKMGQTYIGEEVGNTLSARDYKQPQAVVYGLDRASFNQGQNAKYDFAIESDLSPTILAKGPGGVAVTK